MAISENGKRTVDFGHVVSRPEGAGHLIDGRKIYATGAIGADLLLVRRLFGEIGAELAAACASVRVAAGLLDAFERGACTRTDVAIPGLCRAICSVPGGAAGEFGSHDGAGCAGDGCGVGI